MSGNGNRQACVVLIQASLRLYSPKPVRFGLSDLVQTREEFFGERGSILNVEH